MFLVLEEDGNYYQVEKVMVLEDNGDDGYLVVRKGKRIVDRTFYDKQ